MSGFSETARGVPTSWKDWASDLCKVKYSNYMQASIVAQKSSQSGWDRRRAMVLQLALLPLAPADGGAAAAAAAVVAAISDVPAEFAPDLTVVQPVAAVVVWPRVVDCGQPWGCHAGHLRRCSCLTSCGDGGACGRPYPRLRCMVIK